MNEIIEALGQLYPLAENLGKNLGKKICEAIDYVFPLNSSENENSK